MTIDEARERVVRGAALLDAKQPGWREKVDPETLQMRSECGCVLGQVFGEYVDGLLQVFTRKMDQPQWRYGFNVQWSPNRHQADFDRLQDAWLELLRATP